MLIGIMCGLATCALWGLSFVAPRVVAPYTAIDLTVARYGLFAVVSLILMINPRFRPVGLRRSLVLTGLALGSVGYVGYFMSISYAVRYAGTAIPPLVIGTMPVLLAVIANIKDRSIGWRALAIPLILIAIGIGWVNVSIFARTSSSDQAGILIGIVAALIGLALWVTYGMMSAAVMQSQDAPSAIHWTALQGIGAGIGALVLLPFTSLGETVSFTGAQTLHFLLWAAVMGVAGSWLATLCWMIASRLLPLALAAQLIVAETVFGLFYGFLFEQRMPTVPEAGGAILQLVGVGMAIAIFTPTRPKQA
ncbi:drug/metabolite transporter (DMT)-like permease [Rhizobium sp. BK650]|uniref:DMT family transporter n=1 Tax=Rhizobium sp. BK650 TaxID=2586990 RepID=UPI00161C9CC1|nr:DMT family transporter [Rhizobium sp. BK650]MBB3655967.1 drug/metabolite transporter (DMT)-like permease [Rhizobium sp. BK650]